MSTKRKTNRIMALLLMLCIVFTLLPMKAFAADAIITKKLPISKTVEQAGNAAPPAETFEFVITDTVEDSTLSPEDYGITFGELKIATTGGEGEFTADVPVEIDTTKATEENGWNRVNSAGTDNLLYHDKTFYLTEKDDGKANWTYDTHRYAVTITYYPNGNTSLEIHVPGNDVYFAKAEFKNTYTNNVLHIQKTVSKGGNAAPPAETFEFVITDTVEDSTLSPEDYGITFGELKIATTGGEGEFTADVPVEIDTTKATEENGWNRVNSAGTDNLLYHDKTFYLTEKDDGKANWTYDTHRYAVTITYYPNGNTSLEIHVPGNDVYYPEAEFKNTYTHITPNLPVPTPAPTEVTVDPGQLTVPQTGDNSNIALWMGLAAVSIGGIAGLTVYSRKRKKAE